MPADPPPSAIRPDGTARCRGPCLLRTSRTRRSISSSSPSRWQSTCALGSVGFAILFASFLIDWRLLTARRPRAPGVRAKNNHRRSEKFVLESWRAYSATAHSNPWYVCDVATLPVSRQNGIGVNTRFCAGENAYAISVNRPRQSRKLRVMSKPLAERRGYLGL